MVILIIITLIKKENNIIILARHFTKVFKSSYVLIIMFKSDTKLLLIANTLADRIKISKEDINSVRTN